MLAANGVSGFTIGQPPAGDILLYNTVMDATPIGAEDNQGSKVPTDPGPNGQPCPGVPNRRGSEASSSGKIDQRRALNQNVTGGSFPPSRASNGTRTLRTLADEPPPPPPEEALDTGSRDRVRLRRGRADGGTGSRATWRNSSTTISTSTIQLLVAHSCFVG
jgi:hypothetical protein